MDTFFPFIHKIEKKKKEELQPLHVELEPPPDWREERANEEEAPRVIIIEL